jgi:hypothetical protein
MVELDDIVVHVLDGEGNLNLLDPHLLELQTSHRAGSVLQEDLIYPKAYLLAWFKAAFLQVVLEDFGDQIVGHAHHPLHVPLLLRLYFLIT